MLAVKPLANGGIGDTKTIPASSIPCLVSLSALVVLVLAPCLDPQFVPCHRLQPRVDSHCSLPLRPHRHSTCQDTHSDALHPFALKPQATSTSSLSHFHWGRLLACAPDFLVFLLFSLYSLLLYFFWLYDFLDYRPLWPRVSPWWPCLSCLESLRLVLCCLPRVYTIAFASPCPFYSPMPFTLSVDSLPPVLCRTRRITFRIDVLGRSLTVQLAPLMYLKCLARPVSDY